MVIVLIATREQRKSLAYVYRLLVRKGLLNFCLICLLLKVHHLNNPFTGDKKSECIDFLSREKVLKDFYTTFVPFLFPVLK